MARSRYRAWTPCVPTPTHAEAVTLGAFSGTEAQWTQLTPGMRREIVRQHEGFIRRQLEERRAERDCG